MGSLSSIQIGSQNSIATRPKNVNVNPKDVDLQFKILNYMRARGIVWELFYRVLFSLECSQLKQASTRLLYTRGKAKLLTNRILFGTRPQCRTETKG